MLSGRTGGKRGMRSTFGVTIVSFVMCSRWNSWRRRIICGACVEKEENSATSVLIPSKERSAIYGRTNVPNTNGEPNITYTSVLEFPYSGKYSKCLFTYNKSWL